MQERNKDVQSSPSLESNRQYPTSLLSPLLDNGSFGHTKDHQTMRSSIDLLIGGLAQDNLSSNRLRQTHTNDKNHDLVPNQLQSPEFSRVDHHPITKQGQRTAAMLHSLNFSQSPPKNHPSQKIQYQQPVKPRINSPNLATSYKSNLSATQKLFGSKKKKTTNLNTSNSRTLADKVPSSTQLG